ncbi:hypothetical protein ACFWP7_22035 [Streptomyces sp. NPDC058470]|uniref:hypothetical protein n=1 Tax=Streptomyces sp. NPDC058470 TaxID=3346515 RepID=UPI003668D79E
MNELARMPFLVESMGLKPAACHRSTAGRTHRTDARRDPGPVSESVQATAMEQERS